MILRARCTIPFVLVVLNGCGWVAECELIEILKNRFIGVPFDTLPRPSDLMSASVRINGQASMTCIPQGRPACGRVVPAQLS
ncbi:hypothetical protein GGR55DRAFT_640051 [Xylaria sp. FL0064]|nr:hypothetical protein GGR55DRAFT_640051 [Xylaria sp. FL0064]